MSFTLCSSYAIVINAGSNINSDAAASAAILELFSNEAEGYICSATRYDWITNYSSYSGYILNNLADCAACIAATKLIGYDMDSVGRASAGDRINILYDRAGRCIDFLKAIKKPEDNK